MPRVIFTINYEIYPEKREAYLDFIKGLKEHLLGAGQNNYSVFELKGKRNHFSEIYVFDSVESFDHFEDNEDTKTEEMVEMLARDFVKDGKMSYTTLFEAV